MASKYLLTDSISLSLWGHPWCLHSLVLAELIKVHEDVMVRRGMLAHSLLGV